MENSLLIAITNFLRLSLNLKHFTTPPDCQINEITFRHLKSNKKGIRVYIELPDLI